MHIFKHYNFSYSEVFVFDDFLVNQINEGVTITKEHTKVLAEIITTHFENRPMVYISNRIMSYAVDPLTYIDTASIENLKAIAIITNIDTFKKNAMYERHFYKKPFEIFETLTQAVSWAGHILKNEVQ